MSTTFGVIGLGRMGLRTVQAGRDAGLELVAILDSAATPWGVEQDASLAPFLFDALEPFLAAGPDVVAISTTADSHAPLFLALSENGVKTLLVEKPVACSVEDALGMAQIARARGITALVNHNHRAWAPLSRIKSFDGEARFGRLVSFTITQGAGGLGNLGTHYFDLANWFFDAQPLSVSALGTTPEEANPRGERFEDCGGAALVSYPDGRRLTLEIGDDVGVIGGYEFRFEFGRVLMPFVSEPPQIYIRTKGSQNSPKHFYGAPLEKVAWGDFAPADVVANTAAVFSDLANGTQIAGASLSDAAVALETMIGARLSIERNQMINLPLSEEDRRVAYTLA